MNSEDVAVLFDKPFSLWYSLDGLENFINFLLSKIKTLQQTAVHSAVLRCVIFLFYFEKNY